jgi:hypothetical protein
MSSFRTLEFFTAIPKEDLLTPSVFMLCSSYSDANPYILARKRGVKGALTCMRVFSIPDPLVPFRSFQL